MRLSRALFVLACSVALVAVSCKSDDEPLPSTIKIVAPAAISELALASANSHLQPFNITAELSDDVNASDLIITPTTPEQGGASTFVVRYWVPVTGLSNPATSIGFSQLGDAVGGTVTTWTSISGEPDPLRVLVPNNTELPAAQWWPDVPPAAQSDSVENIRAAIAADPNVLAVLPLDDVDASLHSLAVDGVDIVFGPSENYALVENASVAVHESDNTQLNDILNNVAIQMAGDLSAPPPSRTSMRSTGDIIPVRCAYARQLELGDLIHAFRELAPWLAEADITTASLDTAISDKGVPFGCVETFSLLSPVETIDGLTMSGVDVATVATNHAKDCGQGGCGDDAFFDSMSRLRAAGIQPVGGGADLADARKPVVLTVNGVRFAFLGYDDIAAYYHADAGAPGTAPLDETYVREDVAAAKQQADVVIVMPHWGIEYTADPSERQQTIARAAMEAGATLIVGNHPHWVEAVQTHGAGFVAYSLGNFVFDQDWSLETQQGVVMESVFHGAQLKGVRFLPVHIWDEHQPRFADADESRQIMSRIWTATAALN